MGQLVSVSTTQSCLTVRKQPQTYLNKLVWGVQWNSLYRNRQRAAFEQPLSSANLWSIAVQMCQAGIKLKAVRIYVLLMLTLEVKVTQSSLTVTPWPVARQIPLYMEFSRQEYWSVLPYPSQWDLPDPGIKPTSLTSPALAGRFFTTSTTWKAP